MNRPAQSTCLVLALLAFPLLGRAQECCVNLSFGNVSTSTTVDKEVNFGESFDFNTQFLQSTSAPAGFSVVFAPSQIGLNQTMFVAIGFSPTTMGNYSGTVFLYYRDSGGSQFQYEVFVSGAGIVSGFINPKYVVVGVEYAPPGSQSSATYSSNTVVGSSISVANSFATSVSQSISLSSGTGSPTGIFGFQSSQTATQTNSYTQENDTSSSVAVSQTTSRSTSIAGNTAPAGVNHDFDIIFVWLNPIIKLSVGPSASQVQWNGYGYDLNDTAASPDMEVIGLQVGWLNGHISIPTCAPGGGCVSDRLARAWAQNNVDGSGPGLTNTDLANILAADPFSNPNYALTFPSGSNTTTDGRFTACSNSSCSTTIDFETGQTNGYSQGYSTTTTQSQGSKFTYQQTYSIERQWQGTVFAQHLTLDLKNSTQLTWTSQFTQSTNNSHGQTASFSIVGPPAGYTGPAEFVVYQDNLYGTFMFHPVQ